MNRQMALMAFDRLWVWLFLACLAWRLAVWTWVWVLPPLPPAVKVDHQSPAIGGLLFPDTRVVSAFDPGHYQVSGIWAGVDAFALVSEGNGAPQTVTVGTEMAPGIHVSAILPRSVEVVDAAGQSWSLHLPRTASNLIPDDDSLDILQMGPDHLVVGRDDLARALAAVPPVQHWFKTGADGLPRLTDSSALKLAERLGLQAGDVLLSLDGKPANAGLPALLQARLTHPGSSHLGIRRKGRHLSMTWTIEG